jgi:hypothetical protein
MNDALAGATSAHCRDDPADPLDAAERLAVLQARSLHAQQDLVGPRDLAVAQGPVLHLLRIADALVQ